MNAVATHRYRKARKNNLPSKPTEEETITLRIKKDMLKQARKKLAKCKKDGALRKMWAKRIKDLENETAWQ